MADLEISKKIHLLEKKIGPATEKKRQILSPTGNPSTWLSPGNSTNEELPDLQRRKGSLESPRKDAPGGPFKIRCNFEL